MNAAKAAWDPLHPGELAGLLGGLACPRWLAGGWALELFTGRPIRPHADIDIEVPREALPELRRALPVGLRLLAPEIQLLYKSRNRRPKDEADFDAVVGHLTLAKREWLRDSIDIRNQWHPWLARLAPGRVVRPAPAVGARPQGAASRSRHPDALRRPR